MGLTITNALINVKEGAGVAVGPVANGATIPYTPGAILTFSLASTAGIQSWNLKFKCPDVAGVDGQILEWKAGMANLLVLPMPAQPVSGTNALNGIEVISEVSDGVSSTVNALYFLQTKGGAGPVMIHRANYVVAAALPAYTNVSGVLTANANGSLGTIDGHAVGVNDIVLLPDGIAASGIDAGLYVVTSIGSGGSKWTLSQAPDWQNGTYIYPHTEIFIGDGGDKFGNTTWVTIAVDPKVPGVSSFVFVPRSVSVRFDLVAGLFNITGIPTISNTNSLPAAIINRFIADTTALTVQYLALFTQGNASTAVCTISSALADGSINVADLSTLVVEIINPV